MSRNEYPWLDRDLEWPDEPRGGEDGLLVAGLVVLAFLLFLVAVLVISVHSILTAMGAA